MNDYFILDSWTSQQRQGGQGGYLGERSLGWKRSTARERYFGTENAEHIFYTQDVPAK